MALPTIAFNSSTGSDTTASGAGPGTALTGTGGATTASSGSVNLSVDSPDLSGVATDGSAALWVDTASGRQYSGISGVDNGTKIVTCVDTYAGTASSLRWAIGGQRATLDHVDSRTVLADMKPGWTISLESDQSLTSALAPTVAGDATTGKIRFISSVSGTARFITQTTNAAHFSMVSATNQYYHFQDLAFANTAGTKTSANAFNFDTAAGGGAITWLRCSTNATNPLLRFINRVATANLKAQFINCRFVSTTGIAVNLASATNNLLFVGCRFNANAGGIALNGGDAVAILDCIFSANTADAVNSTGTWTLGGVRIIANNTFYNNTADALDFSGSATFTSGLALYNNIFSSNLAGVRGLAVADAILAYNDYNDFHGNTTARVNLSAGTHDLAVDPVFTDAANGDYTIGTNLKGAGFPTTIGLASDATDSFVDLGAAQREEVTVAAAEIVLMGQACL